MDTFLGTFLIKHIQFCFLELIQEDLDTISLEWNLHKITKSRNSISPHGRPFSLYHNPQQFHTKDYLHTVSEADIDGWISSCSIPQITSDKDVHDLATIVLEERQWNRPRDAITAKELYIGLRQIRMK